MRLKAAAKRSDTSSDTSSDAPATRAVADALRREILLRGQQDRFIGLEDDLVARFNVSKPTFRQAAKLLEHEQILVIKRGAGGGFFAQPPTERVVSQMAAMVLGSRGATLKQVGMVSAPLTVEALRQLALHPDPVHRAKVAEFVAAHAGFENLPGHLERGRVIADFERLVGHLCGNPALELFVEAIRAITKDPKYAEFQISPAQAAAVAPCYRQLAEFVAQGEVELAVVVARRYTSMLTDWLPDIAAEGWVG